ncbi:MAG: AMP-binding protein, partial [Marmoricola sp.]
IQANAVQNATGTVHPTPLEAVNVAAGGKTVGPDLVSATLQPSTNPALNKVLYTFDQSVAGAGLSSADIGSAAFGFAAAGTHPADIVLRGLHHTRTSGVDHPEASLLDILARMGMPMAYDEHAAGVRIRHGGLRLQGTEIDCRDVPDMLPVLSTLAATAEGDTVLHNVEHVRLKESDRVVAMLQLNAMGGDVVFDGSDLRIHGVERLTGAPLSSYNDHRVLMSLAVAAAAAEGRSTLTFPHAYRISYPMFLDSMQTLGLDMGVDKAPARPRPRPVRGPAATPATAEQMTGPAWVRRWAGEHPEQLALVDAHWDRTRHLSWGALDQRADRVATELLRLGVGPGERVALQLPNCSEFVVATVAALRIGAVVCPIMPIFRQREVETVLRRAGARVLVTIDNFRGRQYADEIAALLDETAEPLPTEHVVVVHGTRGVPRRMPRNTGAQAGWRAWYDVVTGTEPDRAAIDERDPRPDDVAQLLFTSGTSGEPKGVEHRHATLSRAAQMEIEHLGLGETDTVYIPSPLAHQTGFLYGMWLAFALGVPQIVQGVWDAHRGLEVLRGWQGTFVQAATPFLTDLVKAVEAGEPAPESLRIFVATGAAVPRALAERATRVLDTAVCGAFGTTETGLGALAAPDDQAANAWGTDGRALPGVRLRVVDDHGRRVPPGVEGNLELTGPTMFDGYLGRPDLTAEAFTDDHWYRTGDLATLDDHEHLRITGRVRDVINRGGEKLPVSEIEQLLYTHPAVEDVAIVAMPDERLGERACAFVVHADGDRLGFAGMQRFLEAAGVSKHYWPERLEPVDALPRNAAGKIQKFKLKQQASALHPQRTDSD